MKKRKNPIKVIIVFILFAIFSVAVFFYLSNRDDDTSEKSESPKIMTAVQEILNRDLSTNYPPTPKEVVKLYSEISRCFYGENYSEEELVQLATKSRKLFDEELYLNQTDEQYLEALKRDIVSWKEENKVISSFSVSSSIDVKEYKYEGREWAQLYCIYSIRIGTNITPVQERYLLRKDIQGHWKILGWEVVEKEEGQ